MVGLGDRRVDVGANPSLTAGGCPNTWNTHIVDPPHFAAGVGPGIPRPFLVLFESGWKPQTMSVDEGFKSLAFGFLWSCLVTSNRLSDVETNRGVGVRKKDDGSGLIALRESSCDTFPPPLDFFNVIPQW